MGAEEFIQEGLRFTILPIGEASLLGLADEEMKGGLAVPSRVQHEGQSYDVTVIGRYAFAACKGLTSVALPPTITHICMHAFSGCKSLTEIAIPEGVESIDWYLFSGCKALERITIPASVTIIGSAALSGCTSLASLTLPAGVEQIGGGVFRKCSALARLEILAPTPPSIRTKLVEPTCTISVPKESLAAYRKAWPWGNFEGV